MCCERGQRHWPRSKARDAQEKPVSDTRKAILYARFSPRKDADRSESIETQFDLCREFCRKHGLQVVGAFCDRALSGADAERPALWGAVEGLRRGWTLVVWKFDRLARDAFLSHLIEKRVQKQAARIVSASGEGTMEAGLSPQEKLHLGILRLFAEFERDVIRQRTREAMRRHQRSGRRMSERCPFGWTPDPTNPAALVAEPEEQAALEQMVALREYGNSFREIARTLEARGVHFRGRATWHPRTVGRILKREGVG